MREKRFLAYIFVPSDLDLSPLVISKYVLHKFTLAKR